MEALFEAFVAKHLAQQLVQPLVLKLQARLHSLVRHQGSDWFRLKPDLLVRDSSPRFRSTSPKLRSCERRPTSRSASS